MWFPLLLFITLLVPSLADACSQFYSVTMDRRGNVIAGTSIAVFMAGTSTPASLYSDPDCTTILTNPLSSTANGTFSFYMRDGRVDMTFTKTGYSFDARLNVNIFKPLGDGVWTVGEFSGTDICAATSGAIDRINSTTGILVINKPVTCSVTKTIPSTLTLQFEGSGTITVAASQTLTVNGYVDAPHGRTLWLGTGTVAFGSGAGPYPYGFRGIVNPTYSTTVTPDTTLGLVFVITVTDNVAFTIAAPTKNYHSEITITVKNASGGAMGAITWNATYKMASFTNPSNGNRRSIVFYWDGSNWVEKSPATNIPN